jgi:hypothetical protein
MPCKKAWTILDDGTSNCHKDNREDTQQDSAHYSPRRALTRPVMQRRKRMRRPGGSFTQQLPPGPGNGEDVQQGSAQAAGKGLPASLKMEEMVSHGD